MKRREFVKQACVTCMGAGLLSGFLVSCHPTHYVSGSLEGPGLSISTTEFTYLKNGEPRKRQFILVQNDKLEFPIFLYRVGENEYSALLMKCSHQGSELQASGDHLYCSSHGSEFDRLGNVTQGPADKNLRSFPVSTAGEKIFIDLKQA